MAWGVNYYGKKREKLAKHERELLLILQEGAGADMVRDAAEEVRSAHIRVVRSELARILPSEKNAAKVEAMNSEMMAWLAVPIESIVEEYREWGIAASARLRKQVTRLREQS